MKVPVPSKARGLLAIRLSTQERAVLEAAAASRPEYLTTFVREAALEAARRELAGSGSANG
jgi:uncharacterized protein (DUF1778 family)